jgi:acetoin utilization protein AcuB
LQEEENASMPLYVKSWMQHDVVWVEEKTPVIKIIELFKTLKLSYLPVLRRGRVVGLIGERDVREVSPSRTEVLDIRELHYLLSKMLARDIMTPNPTTVTLLDTVELAAVKMLRHRVEAVPVVDSRKRLSGIITQRDVLKVLISVTGMGQGGIQIGLMLSKDTGGIETVTGAIKDKGGKIISILGTREQGEEEKRHVFVRIAEMPERPLRRLLRSLRAGFEVIMVKKDKDREESWDGEDTKGHNQPDGQKRHS